MSAEREGKKMGFNATWAMAVGGMVGGGIFSVLGVVVSVAGKWAWLSFVIGGLIALATAHSYTRLSVAFEKGGGAFTFLREIHREGLGGSISWILIIGYTLTISVYATTFGHYLAHVVGAGGWLVRASGIAVIIALTWINLRGVGDASAVEIFTVWVKLIILIGLALFGLARWSPDQLSAGIEPRGLSGAVLGAASVFMAYEGFQLLTYDYDDIHDPRRTLPRASLTAVLVVMATYVMVALGAGMLVGAGAIVEHDEVSLSIAGQAAAGLTGLILVSIAAAFSTASAINATLFATARLARDVAADGELPSALAHENSAGIPDRAVIGIAAAGGTLAVVGSLGTLVESASLAFLFTFAAVNALAFIESVRARWASLAGAVGAGAAGLVLIWRLSREEPVALATLAALVMIATLARPYILRRTVVRTAD